VDEYKLERIVGLVSLGVGLALLAAPARTIESFGMGEHNELGRFLGVRDLILAAGLLYSENPASWLRARAISDAADAALLAGGAAFGAFPRSRSMLGVAVAAGFSALGFILARRLG
jgi:uncharacterized protein YjeT (DUF2065 family)